MTDILAIAAFQALIIVYLCAVNARDRADAAAWRRGEEIGRAYQRGVALGVDLGAARVKDEFDAFFAMRGRINAQATDAQARAAQTWDAPERRQ